MRSAGRRAFIATLGLGVTAGCARFVGRRDSRPVTRPSTGTTPRPGTGDTDRTGPPSRPQVLPLPADPAALREETVFGGRLKDDIPSIDEPVFEPAERAADRIAPGDPVFGVSVGGVAKAYPQSILVWHEICNDTVDGTPVSVTYCPLTGTAMGFSRGRTTFGVSGELLNNNLIMYDRATETWWPQLLATSIPGLWNREPAIRSLREFPVVWTTWDRWSTAHPETLVLSRQTGYARNYDRDPYGSYNPRDRYYAPDSPPLFPTLSEDDRLPPKQVVVGTRHPDGAFAVTKDRLRSEIVVEGQFGATQVLAVHDPDLDTGYVYRNPDGLEVTYEDGLVIDGTGRQHQPDGLPLDRMIAIEAMWFAWIGLYPHTTLYH